MLDRIFRQPALGRRAGAQLTPREFAALRGAVGYAGSRLAREQITRTEEDPDGTDAVVLLNLLARFQANVDPASPNVALAPGELSAACAALYWAARDLERYAVHLRSWQGWSLDDQEVRDWLVSNFPDSRDDAIRAEATAVLARTVWLTLREHQRAWQPPGA